MVNVIQGLLVSDRPLLISTSAVRKVCFGYFHQFPVVIWNEVPRRQHFQIVDWLNIMIMVMRMNVTVYVLFSDFMDLRVDDFLGNSCTEES
jgi:hypothetical protein